MARPKHTEVPPGIVRQTIVNAASTIFAQEGAAGLTYRRIANQIGISPGTMTYHFDDRHQLVSEALKSLADNVEADCLVAMRLASNKIEAQERLADLICNSNNSATFMAPYFYNPEHADTHAASIRIGIDKAVTALQLHFDEKSSRAIMILIGGLAVNQRLSYIMERTEVLEIIRRVS